MFLWSAFPKKKNTTPFIIFVINNFFKSNLQYDLNLFRTISLAGKKTLEEDQVTADNILQLYVSFTLRC